MSKTVLVTGFEPFAGSNVNPSQLVVSRLQEMDFSDLSVIAEVLPVEFDAAVTKLIALIEQHDPAIVIALGQAEGRTTISIERVAINFANANIPDNGGTKLMDQEIIDGGTAGYFSTLPVTSLVDLLVRSEVKASQSLSAGSFVCNYIFYQMQALLLNRNVKSGFIHLPLVPEQQNEFPNIPTMPLDEMVKGIKLIIEFLAEAI